MISSVKMSATLKKVQSPRSKVQGSSREQTPTNSSHRRQLLIGPWTLVLGISLLCTPLLSAADTSALPEASSGAHSNRVHRIYVEAKEQFTRDPTNSQTAWQFARACFERADFSTTDAQRGDFAEQGIAASKRAIELNSNSAAAYFYLGVNLGQLARTKLFTALGLLDEMEVAWEKSIALDAKFHYAAAERSLGLLYLDAPGWPLSLGSRSKARQHLQKATERVPDYPENHLCWLEAQLKWGETKTVKAQLATVEIVMQSARTNLTGEQWSRDWEDWDARWKTIKAKTDGSVSIRSPRGAK